ncbi:YdeI/OmpD-associated family protein [Microbulbifer elongatus]|uniref:YdeI/OmpD-associated family protein n=1 Tax=Microbulbifer elongatus TaxID=86173 RepID=UPI001E594658|nr:YdeI/OmpD-associated family protein [Microbulbifer elongatus]
MYQFREKLLRPKVPGDNGGWAFVVLPKEASAILPRRGRTTVNGRINGKTFQALLEPDGRKSHWLRIDKDLLESAGTVHGDVAEFEIEAVDKEPEPEVPSDFDQALMASPQSRATWDATTTIARIDWIHWIESAKQAKTRIKRIQDACNMLAEGKKRVCCFDTSGFYSKALSAPKTAD